MATHKERMSSDDKRFYALLIAAVFALIMVLGTLVEIFGK